MQQVSLCCASLFLTVLAQFCLAPSVLSAQDQPSLERLSDAESMRAQPIFLSETELVT